AALGLANLEDFSKILKRRRKIATHYRNVLKNVAGLKLLDYKNDRESAYWLFTILVDNRVNFIKKLKSYGIPTSVVHLRIDRNSVFGGFTPNFPNQEKFDQNQVSIPIHDALDDGDVEKIESVIKSGW
ncbi:MAG: DegT/DnrJ/EryC1/StrS aminotransferase, partial [uncultured bacterium]